MREVIGLLVLASFFVMGCDPLHAEFPDEGPAELFDAADRVTPRAVDGGLRVMTWNLRFGAGRTPLLYDCGGGAVLLDEDVVRENMGRIAARIAEEDPDIVLLQEVERLSKRTGFVDELEILLEETELNHAAYAAQWRVDYVPQDGIGRIDHGIAILSRWPFTDARRIALAGIESLPPWERYFHLRRALLVAEVDIPGQGPVTVVGVHAEPADVTTKRAHLDAFEAALVELDDGGRAFVGGGDLNALPPGSPRWHDFPDECPGREGADFRGEEHWLDDLYARFAADVPTSTFVERPDEFYTFSARPTARWARKLDHIFSNRVLRAPLVLQDERTGTPTADLSDHAPIVVTLELTR